MLRIAMAITYSLVNHSISTFLYLLDQNAFFNFMNALFIQNYIISYILWTIMETFWKNIKTHYLLLLIKFENIKK